MPWRCWICLGFLGLCTIPKKHVGLLTKCSFTCQVWKLLRVNRFILPSSKSRGLFGRSYVYPWSMNNVFYYVLGQHNHKLNPTRWHKEIWRTMCVSHIFMDFSFISVENWGKGTIPVNKSRPGESGDWFNQGMIPVHWWHVFVNIERHVWYLLANRYE